MRDNGTNVPFRKDKLSDAQEQSLALAVKFEDILNFIRGRRDLEATFGKPLRPRNSMLGDIIHSRPFYWKPNNTVYVGANDGMLHAFDADTCREVFAYIPSMLIHKIKYLSSLPYEHLYYVDGQINVGKVKIDGADRNLLVGGLGAGGRGLYALDITTPVIDPITNNETEQQLADRSAKLIRWEITPSAINYVASTSYADLGYTYGTPVIAEADTGSVVIVGNGYRNEGSGRAVLYIIDPKTGNLLKAIDACASGADCGTTAEPNGLSTPTAIDTNKDGKVDRVYAGDLNGNLWKFDISSVSSGSVSLLFQAGQAITGAPAVAMHPEGGYIVVFGTGRMLVSDIDENDPSIHSVYGIWDGAPSSNTTLLEQTLVEKSYANGSVTARVRVASTHQPNWSSGGHRGWRTKLPAGERAIADLGFIENGRYYFTATNPTVSSGENWLLELDYLTGGGRNKPFLDLNGDSKVNAQDTVTVSDSEIANKITGVPIGKWMNTGLLSHPVLARMAKTDTTLFNSNPNMDFETSDSPTDSGGPGISDGHFDFDIYYGGSSFRKQKHVHEYDDKYDVTGVNMLNASDPDFNLADNAITSSTVQFKVLMANQGLSPAVKFKVGPANHVQDVLGLPVDADGYASVRDYQTTASLPTKVVSGVTVLDLPTYTTATVTNLLMNMPKDAFAAKDWWGDGTTRVGLIPTATGCVNGMSARNYNPTPGRDGEINNGAITVQLIKADTPASAVELNVASDPKRGWRVKASNFTNYLLAQYTLFWHNGACYSSPNWTPTPSRPVNPKPNKGGPARAAGSADPTTNTSGTAVVATTVTTTYTKDALRNLLTSTSTTKLSSNGRKTEETIITRNADGSVTIVEKKYDPTTAANPLISTSTRTLYPDGQVVRGLSELRGDPLTGRVSWREFFRE